jgi:hypothetical protein
MHSITLPPIVLPDVLALFPAPAPGPAPDLPADGDDDV